MGYCEVFIIDENGAGWVDLADAPSQVKLDIEIGLFQEGAL